MQVTSYLRPEMAEIADDEESQKRWEHMVQELGLKGQVSDKSTKAIPFLAMNTTLKKAIATLCPSECNVDAYGYDAIPLEALELIEKARNSQRFARIVVAWDEKTPDPVAMGITGKWRAVNRNWNLIGEYDTEDEAKSQANVYNVSFTEAGRFMIARWGAEFRALSQLIEDAKDRFIREKTNEARKQIADWQHKLATVDLEAAEAFG